MWYQVDFLLPLKLEEIWCYFWLWSQNAFDQPVCRIFYFWLVWHVKRNTGGPLLHCTFFTSIQLPCAMRKKRPWSSLFHMKITASVTNSSHQDRGPCYLHSPIFSYTFILCWKIKSCCDSCFPQQIRPYTAVQWYILGDYSIVRIGFNMINKRHTLSMVYTLLKSFKSVINHYCFT